MIYRSAYFMSPAGDIIDVNQSHIACVIKCPERFGWSHEKIEAVFRRFGERLGLEGLARKEILTDVIQKGWIRFRRYKEHWAVTLNRFEGKEEMLEKWAETVPESSETPVVIRELETGTDHNLRFAALLQNEKP